MTSSARTQTTEPRQAPDKFHRELLFAPGRDNTNGYLLERFSQSQQSQRSWTLRVGYPNDDEMIKHGTDEDSFAVWLRSKALIM